MKMASSSALLGVFLAVSMFGAGVLAEKMTSVYITNLPLDERGNLKIAVAPENKTMIAFNRTITVSSSPDKVYLTSFDTYGFKSCYIVARIQGSWQLYAEITVMPFENNLGIQTRHYGVGDIYLDTGSNTDPQRWGMSYGLDPFEIHSSKIDLYLKVYHSDIGFNGLMTIVVYLTD